MNTPFEFKKLDSRTRALMVANIQLAIHSGNLYHSSRFTPVGDNRWPELLEEAAKLHDEIWLAEQLELLGAMKSTELHRNPKVGYSSSEVPDTATQTLAGGQFNRHYIMAICERALQDGVRSVIVIRAKQRRHPRPESEAIIGSKRDAAALLDELRSLASMINCDLLQPNSGLSVTYEEVAEA